MSAPEDTPVWVRELARRAEAVPDHLSVRIVRVEVEAPGAEPLAWLSAQTEPKRGYWADRDGDLEAALVGEADELKGMDPGDFSGWEKALAGRFQEADGDLRYYGGFRFGAWHPQDRVWAPFGASRFILPRIELYRRAGGVSRAALNLVRDDAGRWPVPRVPALSPAPAVFLPPALPRVEGRVTEPDDAGWAAGVGRALAAIHRSDVSKVVLARRTRLHLAAPVDALALLHGIREATGRCFQFCGSHGAGFAFVGASPERLYRRNGRRLASEAVAGTRRRGATEAEDLTLAAELRSSDKEGREHRLVRDRILRGLASWSEELTCAPEPGILQLGLVQHLHTPIQAVLKPGISDAALLARLHPTPATAGEPVAESLRLLAELEPFDRGWYAGPVGWVSRDAAEFAVALRCGLAVRSHLLLYAGAGVVSGSEPAAEAREIEAKLAPFLRLVRSA